jgi:hypothetical protein
VLSDTSWTPQSAGLLLLARSRFNRHHTIWAGLLAQGEGAAATDRRPENEPHSPRDEAAAVPLGSSHHIRARGVLGAGAGAGLLVARYEHSAPHVHTKLEYLQAVEEHGVHGRQQHTHSEAGWLRPRALCAAPLPAGRQVKWPNNPHSLQFTVYSLSALPRGVGLGEPPTTRSHTYTVYSVPEVIRSAWVR